MDQVTKHNITLILSNFQQHTTEGSTRLNWLRTSCTKITLTGNKNTKSLGEILQTKHKHKIAFKLIMVLFTSLLKQM